MPPTNKIDISSGTLFRILLILLAVWFIYTVFDIVIMLFAAFIIASAIEPLACYGDKYKVPRAVSVLAVYVLVLLILAGTISLMIEPLVEQTEQLAMIMPGIVNTLNKATPLIPSINQDNIIQSAQSGLINFSDNIASFGLNIFAGTKSVITGLINLLFVFVIALYLVIERDATKKLGRLLTPKRHFPYIEQAIERAQRGVGRWVLGQIVLGAVVGLLIGVGVWLIGVRYALLLGLVAAVMELIPVIGPMIGAAVGIIIAISQGWIIGLITFIYYVAIGQLENHVLVPNIMKRAVGLPPLVTIIAVIVGAKIMGILGIILAVPAATVINVFITDITAVDETQELSG